MKEEIIGRGVPAERISVVPNVVDVDRFLPRDKDEELIARYGLGSSRVVGYISNLGWREGIQYLIEAVALLRADGHDVKGLVAGDGPERDYLDSVVADLGLEGSFILTGHVPNDTIEDHYALIDAFVVPRVQDRAARLVTPLKPLEAMAMGRPVIAADLPALRELVDPDRRGLVFESEDARSLATAIERLFGDDELRSAVVKTARQWVMEERTLDANARRYAEILGGTLSGAGS